MKSVKKFYTAGLMLSLVSVFIPFHINAQSEGALPAFDKIILKGASKVELTQGAANSITSNGESLSSDVSYKVNGSTLIVDGGFSKVEITFQNLSSIEVAGTSKVEGTNPIKTKNLQLEVSGVGSIKLQVEADDISTNISGAGKITLSGTANLLNAEISGAGKVDAEELKAVNGSVNISGSGKAYVDIKEKLDATVSGTGSIYYANPPATVNKSLSGIGNIGNMNSVESDTTRISWGKKKILIIGDKAENMWNKDSLKNRRRNKMVDVHWAGFELGFNGLVNDDYEMPSEGNWYDLNFGKSVAVNINFFDIDFPLYSNYIKAFTGLGLSYNNYRFRKDFTLISSEKQIAVQFDSISYTKNKLTMSWLTVPLMIEFNTSQYNSKSLHLAAGMTFSYMIGSHTKHVYYEGSEKVKTKEFNDFHLTPFRYELSARIGFSNYTLFANYALSELFRDKQGPVLHPWSFGITVVGW